MPNSSTHSSMPCVYLSVCVLSLHPSPQRVFCQGYMLRRPIGLWFSSVQPHTQARIYTHKDAKSENERVVPPGPHLMETRSPGVLEHSSAPLSLRSTRGSIIMTHYTNSHHTHTLGFLFFTVSHLRQVDRALLLLLSAV